MEGKKKSNQMTVAFSMGNAAVIERALISYKENLIEDFRDSDSTDEDLSIFANDLSKIDRILESIRKAKARYESQKAGN